MMNRPEAEKQGELATQSLHLEQATSARVYLKDCVDRCKASLENLAEETRALGPHQPLTGPDVGHYGFDFAQQVRTQPSRTTFSSRFTLSQCSRLDLD